jgi:hypothetical protein
MCCKALQQRQLPAGQRKERAAQDMMAIIAQR